MAEKLQVYKCDACGNIVEVLHGGGGELVCCGEAMKLMQENTVDAAKEKHVPVIEKADGSVTVKVGSWTRPPVNSAASGSISPREEILRDTQTGLPAVHT